MPTDMPELDQWTPDPSPDDECERHAHQIVREAFIKNGSFVTDDLLGVGCPCCGRSPSCYCHEYPHWDHNCPGAL
jgi:hypothetical protein